MSLHDRSGLFTLGNADRCDLLSWLNALPPEIHWFCSRGSTSPIKGHDRVASHADIKIKKEDGDTYPIDDINDPKTPSNVKGRIEIFYQALPILGFDSPDAVELQKVLKEHIGAQLTCCDHCIYGYYESRPPFVQRLHE